MMGLQSLKPEEFLTKKSVDSTVDPVNISRSLQKIKNSTSVRNVIASSDRYNNPKKMGMIYSQAKKLRNNQSVAQTQPINTRMSALRSN